MNYPKLRINIGRLMRERNKSTDELGTVVPA